MQNTIKQSLVFTAVLLAGVITTSCGPSGAVFPGVVLPDMSVGSSELRIIALGDAGTGGLPGGGNQQLVADDTALYGDFVLYLGDNFYETGVQSLDDPLWASAYQDIYNFTRLPQFYVVAGNHDHYGNALAQVDYAATDPTWTMPALSYSFSWSLNGGLDGGDRINFLAIDTQTLVENEVDGDFDAIAHWRWIENRLIAVSGGNIIVFGHHPVFSAGAHGEDANLQILVDRLHPLMAEHGVDLYLAGHDHNLEIRQPVEGVNYVISGSGGKLRAITAEPESLYAASVPGAVIIEINSAGFSLTVRDSLSLTNPYSVTRTWN